MEVNKLKTKRKTIRTYISKLLKKIESEIEKKDFDKNNIEENLNLLCLKSETLQEIDKQIESLLEVKDDCAEYEEELNACQEYEEKIKLCIFRAKKKINIRDENSKDISENPHDHIAFCKNEKQNIRLPKLTISKFYGDSSVWLDFWNQFSHTIHENNELNKIEKFNYLKMYLGGQALNCVSGFALNEKNYDSCIEMLKERFGRNDLVISSHMKNLLAIEPIKNISNIKALRKFYDNCEIQIRSLQALNVASGSYGNLLCPVILQKLPDELSLEYNRKRESNSDFNITELLEFVRKEIECREASCVFSKDYNSEFQNRNKSGHYNQNNYSKRKLIPTASALATLVKPYCFYCRVNTHDVGGCEKSDEEKRNILKLQGRCYRCIRKGHVSSSCRTKIPPCEICCIPNSHNKLFCKKSEPEVPLPENDKQNVIASLSLNSEKNKGVYLQTCSVLVSDEKNNKQKNARILLDGGSQKSFIRSDLAKQLNLKCIRKETLYIYSFGFTEGREQTFDIVRVNLKNTQNPKRSITIETLVTDVLTGAFVKVPNKKIRHMLEAKHLQIADACEPSEIKILVGSDYYWEIQGSNKLRLDDNLYASDTLFGWSVQGSNSQNNASKAVTMHIAVSGLHEHDGASLNESIQKFWSLDSLGIKTLECKNKKSEEAVVKQFKEDLQYSNGRYIAGLLWKENYDELSDNFENAKSRLMSLSSKFKRDEWLCKNYNEIIKEQLENKIIEECEFESKSSNVYYMPHSPVIRKNVSTTKVRIVYDASSKQNNAVSLNDCIEAGPNLNPSVLDIILRFRQYKYAFSADIEKAFHQIGIRESDRDALRFLYFDKDANLKPFRMTRVPFGVSCSPFILACTIKKHIENLSVEKPEVFDMLNSSLYVDDLYYGSKTLEEAFKLSAEAHKTLGEAGMILRKFRTNSNELKNLWNYYNILKTEDESNNSVKVLGLNWCTQRDIIFLNIEALSETLIKCQSITKRNILSITATIFDPVGFISPFVLRAKLIIQQLWQLGLDFDEDVPNEHRQLWSEWCNEVEHLSKFLIKREYFTENVNMEDQELHIFCDASMKAYGAVAYFRCRKSSSTSFVMSKSRVAPINKKLTLPRLELLGAVISARLSSYLKELFNLQDWQIFLWTDSTIVVHWINGSPDRWKLFVKNRVIEVQSLTDPACWRHCDGSSNPADILSRGCSAEKLLSSKLWRSGPDWLTEPEGVWPGKFNSPAEFSDPELVEEQRIRKVYVLPSIVDSNTLLNLEKVSKLSRATRVTGWILRFIHNSKNKNGKRDGPLTAEELFAAELLLIKKVQYEKFPDEFESLKAGQLISKNSKIYELNPFLSDDGVLRLGGRLQKSSLSFHEQHPIIIPSKCHFTDLLIRDAHEQVLHTGVANTLMFLRQKYWIIRSRQNIKRIVKNCVICQRYNSRPMQQAIAPLPASRIEQTNPFDVVGLDYAGPLFVKNEDTKYYILLFTCAVTRGIHLELTKDLTTKSFLLAFRRFVSRRGLCSIIYSDNARTFKAADAELRQIWKVLTHPEVKNFYATKGIQWRYIIERGAWWGGFYERLVRTVKTILRKILGRTSIPADELETVLIEIESVINHRPLTYVQDDEPLVVSPAHFLLGKKLTNLPPVRYSGDVKSTKEVLLKMYRYRENLMNNFWKHFFKEYLLNLKSANCSKNHQAKLDLKVNDMVIISDEHLPRNMWKLGKVQKTFSGRDGLIRSCELKTEKGIIKRPVQLLVKLEC